MSISAGQWPRMGPTSATGAVAASPIIKRVARTDKWGFRLVMLYLLLEFGRPQDFSSVIAALRLPALTTMTLVILLLTSGRLKGLFRSTRPFQVLLVLMLAHVPTALNNYWAFWITWGMAQIYIVYLAIIAFVDTEKKLETAAVLWVAIHGFLAVHAFMNRGTGVGGFLGDENDVAMTLDMVVPVAFFLAIDRSAGSRKRALMFSCLFLVTLAIPLTMSRGGLIGLSAVTVYCVLRSPRKMVSAGMVLILGMMLVVAAPPEYWVKMKTIFWPAEGKEDTGAGRVYEWKVGWKMFLGNPVFGVGAGNFAYRFAEYEADTRWFDRSLAGRAAHSVYFTLMPELGLLGTLLVARMVFTASRATVAAGRAVRRLAKLSSHERFASSLSLGLLGSLLGFMVASTFISSLYYPNLWVLLAFMEVLGRQTAARAPANARPA